MFPFALKRKLVDVCVDVLYVSAARCFSFALRREGIEARADRRNGESWLRGPLPSEESRGKRTSEQKKRRSCWFPRYFTVVTRARSANDQCVRGELRNPSLPVS